jgi:glycosyltransferase involved in cell wall biosynthesis
MTDQKNKKVLFLFTELAGYIVSCMNELAETPGIDLHVVRWPVNAIAPFKFSFEKSKINLYERNEFNNEELEHLADEISPDIIFCSGWIDKGYVNICRSYYGKVKTVLTFDNPWRGTLKQHVASLISPFYLRNLYSDCWVCGSPQKKYALKLGFNEQNIQEGFYSCDFNLFHDIFEEHKALKNKSFPKRFLFVGRYTKLKGAAELWNAFEIFMSDNKNDDWELWCLGKGEFEDQFPENPRIKNFGFVQPEKIDSIIKDTGVFILPSHYEHWGVVVHEFAAAGLPLLCTTSTGAATTFLKEGENGYFFRPKSVQAIVDALQKIADLDTDRLITMGEQSAKIAETITPAKWADQVTNYLK